MRKGKLLIIVGSVAFVALVLYSLFSVQPVKVLSSRLERRNGRVFVAGKVENTSSRPAAIDLEVHYYASDGRKLAQDTIAMDGLKAGQVRNFKTPARDLPGVADFSLYLNHGRNPYGN